VNCGDAPSRRHASDDAAGRIVALGDTNAPARGSFAPPGRDGGALPSPPLAGGGVQLAATRSRRREEQTPRRSPRSATDTLRTRWVRET
jgi:hypothetical protein